MGKRKKKKKLKRSVKISILVIILIVFALVGKTTYEYHKSLNQKLEYEEQEKEYYTLSDFGLINEKTGNDQNNNGKDDIEDILEGEQKMIKINPKYISKYYENGYAPETEGVCTDLVWYCFNNAGYDLKKLISKDIENTRKKKIYYIDKVDQNIDFRRVGNQKTFFMRYAETLGTDMYDIGDFMPGDIVTFDNSDHIAMIGEKYNKNGVPYLVQNRDSSQKQTEENRLEKTDMKITGHYRLKYTEDLKKLIEQTNKN